MKKFLSTFAAVAASFAAQSASAAPSPTIPSSQPESSAANAISGSNETVAVQNGSGDLFNFLLKRNGEGQLMAWHESHASHASHSSHTSHYSSRY